MCGALSLRKCVVPYHRCVRARELCRTFLPAYLPRLMMATRPTLRTRRTLSAVVAERSRRPPYSERDCKELRCTYTSWLLVGTVSMSCRSKSSGQRNLESAASMGEFRKCGHVNIGVKVRCVGLSSCQAFGQAVKRVFSLRPGLTMPVATQRGLHGVVFGKQSVSRA